MKIRVIELTKGYVTVISSEDYRRVNRHSWRVNFSAGSKRKVGKPYARATIRGKDVYLHRFIMQAPDGFQVDHKNGLALKLPGNDRFTVFSFEFERTKIFV